MPSRFVGRQVELAQLEARLGHVRREARGELLAIPGRRQVGKTRLAEEFVRTADVPSVFFAASRNAEAALERRRFVRLVAASQLEAAAAFGRVRTDDWLVVLQELAERTTQPTIVVIDELPYLLEGDPTLEGVLQTAWDRHLSHSPLLVVVLGSHLSMMRQLSDHGRPLFGRVRELRLEPLTVADTAAYAGLEAADAFDAHLVIGGYPRVLQEWTPGSTLRDFVDAQLHDSTSPLIVVGERIVTAEFPTSLQAGAVVEAIGAGARTFGAIAQRLDLNQGSLSRTLQLLVDDAGVVDAVRPLSTRRSSGARYVVADPYLRFWLHFIQPRMELLFRDRADVVTADVLEGLATYRGSAVEPLVRQSIERLLPHPAMGGTRFVGTWWSRAGDVEVDLVGGSRDHAPSDVHMIGSVKWRQRRQFSRDDLLELAAARERVPGAQDAALVGVSRAGFSTGDLDVALRAEDLLDAWRK